MSLSSRLSKLFRRLSQSVVLWVAASSAAIDLSDEQIKAAYLYNFAKFAEWPSDILAPDSDIRVCVVGEGPVNEAISALQGRKIGEHLVNIMNFKHTDSGLERCQLLFFAQSEQTRFLVTLKALGNAPVLTISDIEDFAEKGGGVGLVYREDKVKFEVNLDSVRVANLHLPGQLLNIATHVYGN